MKKNNLLLISELSRLTDASIYSLRYYERIGILKPTYIDVDTGYRYYSFEQIFHVTVILFCVELDIPLKELVSLKDKERIIDFLGLLNYGKKIAEAKLIKINKGLNFAEEATTKILNYELSQRQNRKIYTQSLAKKYLHVIPYSKPFGGLNQFEEVAKAFLDFEYGPDDDYSPFSEFGLLYEYKNEQIQRYVFIELDQKQPKNKNAKVLPKGEYYCVQNSDISIEKSSEIFSDFLNTEESYIAIETVFFAGKFSVGNPISELRVIKT